MTRDEAFAHDWSKTVFSQGLVCFNTNNYQYCVVIKGDRGTDNDRCSLVLEFSGSEGFMLHTPPNRALIPTGKVVRLEHLAKTMRQFVVVDEKG